MATHESKTNESSNFKAVANHSLGKRSISFIPSRFKFTIQPKLTVNQPNDTYEQEADKTADQIMRLTPTAIPSEPLKISSLQRIHGSSEVSERSSPPVGDADESFGNYIERLNSGGQSISDDVRSFFEPRFGYDFSNVKVHADSSAARSAQSINALAYTSSNNIVFNRGQYSPNTEKGKSLIGHELTHVVQQGGEVTNSNSHIQKEGGDEDKPWISSVGDVLEGVNDATGGLIPGLGLFGGAVGGAGDFAEGVQSGDPTKFLAGGLGSVGHILDMAGELGEDTLGGGADVLGGAGNLFGFGKSALDAYSDFSKGDWGKGALDTVTGAGQGLSSAAAFGGFSLLGEGGVAGAMSAISEGGLGTLGTVGGIEGSALTMDAGAALAGGGAEGLAALGPAGAVIAAGMGGAAIGSALYNHTSVGPHAVDSLGGLDSILTGEGERPWSLRTSEAMSDDWDRGDYLSSIGNGAELAGFATVGALGGIGGGIVDGVSAIGGGISDLLGDIF